MNKIKFKLEKNGLTIEGDGSVDEIKKLIEALESDKPQPIIPCWHLYQENDYLGRKCSNCGVYFYLFNPGYYPGQYFQLSGGNTSVIGG